MAENQNNHPHLELVREEPITERRSRPFGPTRTAPDNFQEHAHTLRQRLRQAQEAAQGEVGGFDERRLIKIELTEKMPPERVANLSRGIEIVSQEDGTLVLTFATDSQLDDFEARLASLASGHEVTYQNLMYALEDLGNWTPEDRKGWALREDGFPEVEPFILDVEIWPLDHNIEKARLAFEQWVEDNHGEHLDAVRQPYLTLYRIRCSRALAEDLLRHRDVRTVDLPPRIGLEHSLQSVAIEDLEDVPNAPENAPGVAILDSGIVAGHPLLAPAVGDAQSYIQDPSPADEHGHGTRVAGIALYNDVAQCVRDRRFVPTLRLFSGRILDDQNATAPRLVENQVEEAVRYFVEQYGCRVFNLSYGDRNKPYQGRHVAGLAVTLDAISREMNVLFVVPTGNFEGDGEGPANWRDEYPSYLIDRCPLLDPAPALNALTVGSLARHERNERWPNDPAYMPVARVGQPSPFTRHGPSVNGAIKPDLVDYGGNYIFNARTPNLTTGGAGVGELSTNRDFAGGLLFAEDVGTSFAAPRVANAAASIFAELPNAGMNLVRALLVSHARTPPASAGLLDKEALRNLTGYGLVDRAALYRSFEDYVTLWAEGRIQNRRHHFYEVPIPEEFWQGNRRNRELTVALAYRPPVRTTRIDYKAVGISFMLVKAESLDQVARAFNAATDRETDPSIQERIGNRNFTAQERSRGTVQASTWSFKQPSQNVRESSWFVVVTRNDPAWGESISSERESYALVVTLADRLAEQPRLYTRIDARLRARARATV